MHVVTQTIVCTLSLSLFLSLSLSQISPSPTPNPIPPPPPNLPLPPPTYTHRVFVPTRLPGLALPTLRSAGSCSVVSSPGDDSLASPCSPSPSLGLLGRLMVPSSSSLSLSPVTIHVKIACGVSVVFFDPNEYHMDLCIKLCPSVQLSSHIGVAKT